MIGMSPGDHLSPAALPVLCPGMSPPPLQDSGFILLLPPQFPLGKDAWAQGPCQRDNKKCGLLPGCRRGPAHWVRPDSPQGWVLQSLALPVNTSSVLEAGMLGAAALFPSSGQKSHHILPGKNCP